MIVMEKMNNYMPCTTEQTRECSNHGDEQLMANRGQLDQKERERCMRENRCFTCKRTGHHANQCNKRREGWSKNDAGPATRLRRAPPVAGTTKQEDKMEVGTMNATRKWQSHATD